MDSFCILQSAICISCPRLVPPPFPFRLDLRLPENVYAGMLSYLETPLAGLPFLAPLRPDELRRAAKRFRDVRLAPDEARPIGAAGAEALVVLEGRVLVETTSLEGEPPRRATL